MAAAAAEALTSASTAVAGLAGFSPEADGVVQGGRLGRSALDGAISDDAAAVACVGTSDADELASLDGHEVNHAGSPSLVHTHRRSHRHNHHHTHHHSLDNSHLRYHSSLGMAFFSDGRDEVFLLSVHQLRIHPLWQLMESYLHQHIRKVDLSLTSYS